MHQIKRLGFREWPQQQSGTAAPGNFRVFQHQVDKALLQHRQHTADKFAGGATGLQRFIMLQQQGVDLCAITTVFFHPPTMAGGAAATTAAY